jgi:hypothetical protein
MHHHLFRNCFAFALALGASSFASSAFAATYNPPAAWGNVLVDARIGQETSGAKNQVIVWTQRDNPSICSVTIMAGSGGLTEDAIINGSNLTANGRGDLMVLQAAGDTTVYCGRRVGPLVTFANRLVEVHAGDGPDIILGGVSTGVLSLFGGNDGDIIAGTGTFNAFGEAGDDDVEAWGTAPFQQIYGDGLFANPLVDGKDCLWDENRSAQVLQCDSQPAGKKDTSNTTSTANPNDCELTAPANCCTWAHFAGKC